MLPYARLDAGALRSIRCMNMLIWYREMVSNEVRLLFEVLKYLASFHF